jgi:TonB-linked SusC/RagA family outer membrane protein
MKKLFLLLMAVISVSLFASAQTQTVIGTVLDASDDEPIIGASVTAGSAKAGVATDVNGEFRLSVPAGVKTITVSHVGYAPQTLNIAKGRMMVRLDSSVETKDEVIVVAYGTAKKSEYTGSAGVIKADQLEDALVSNVTNAMSGKIAGVQTLSSNGQPGTSSSIRIRGVGSINASSAPLYVVDGLPFDGDIATISNNDIESLTVIKDAASTALYGARGANGVVLITTKKGKEGQAKVTVDMRWGGNSRAIPQYDVISDARQYLETVYAAHYQQYYASDQNAAAARQYALGNLWSSIGYQTWSVPNGQEFIGTNGKFNPNATPGYVSGNYTYLADDWTKETLVNGLRQEYNLSVSGGNERLQYYVSGNYLGDEGIISNSHFKRFSTRTSVDYKAKNWLKIGTNMSYTYTNTGYPSDQDLDNSSSTGNAFNIINSLGPVYPMYIRDAQGNIIYNTRYNRPIYDYGDGADYGYGRTPSRNTYSSSNPAGDLLYNREDYLSDVFNGKWYATITPVEGLNITGTAGYMVDNTRMHYLANSLYGQSASYGGQAEQAASRYRTINLQALASYQRQFGDHNLSLMVGFENQSYQSETVYAIGSVLYNPDSWVVNNTSDQKSGGGSQANLVHRGFLANLKYNLLGRYYFTLAGRRDGSSRFAPNHRWGTFWSVSGAWDVSKENFMQDTKSWIDMLKLRASFGQNGNDAIGSNYIAYADQYTLTGSDGVWSDGTLYYKGNEDITWETSNSFNVGVDFSLWKGKLSGSIEYYSRQTSDMLFYLPVSPSLGYSSVPYNVGSMRNNGVEIDLAIQPIKTKNFSWEINGNITFGWNKVLKLDPSILNTATSWQYDSKMGWLSGSRMFIEGQSMYNFWMVDYAGVDSDNGDALFWALRDKTDADGNKVVYAYQTDDQGNVVLDADGNKVVKQYVQEEYKTNSYSEAYNTNRKATGNLMPKGYGGFGTTFNAYGFDLSLQFAYQFGGHIYDSAYASFMYTGDSSSLGQNWHKDILNAWTEDNKTSNIPRLATDGDQIYANSTSTRFLTSSNYLSLNNITFGYTFPAKWTRQAKVEGIRLYFAAENVALWSARKGLDPRQSYTSSSNSTYSPIRTISGGIKVTF